MSARSERCWTCGRRRGLEPQRREWSLNIPCPWVPRTEDPSDAPSQIANDLICRAAIYRNGGWSDETHLCDQCLRIGLRAIKVAIDRLLTEIDGPLSKDEEIADLTQRLSKLQLKYYNACRLQPHLPAGAECS